MKTLAFLISILLISNIFSSECSKKSSPSSAEDCNNLAVGSGKDKCCYIIYKYTEKSKEKEETCCYDITKAEYDDITKTKEDIEKGAELDNLRIIDFDCKNEYIKFSILSLIELILL